MVVGENKRTANIMDGIENTGDVRMHDHRLRLKQRFDIVRKLGQGTYGKVQLGINKKTGQEVAIKTIKKCKIESEADLVRIRREVQIMSSVRHPNIVHIYEVFENSEKMILVMEYCSGGELYDYLSQKKVLQEDEARRLFRQIATAVYYCHIHKICHRDLKLENVLLDDTGSAKIADFGLSNVFKETSLLSTFCGSPLYASPEIVKGTPYIGPEVDCWSLGVLLYTLVYGAMPFDGSNFKRLVRQISNGDYYEPRNPSTASPLIRDMLTVDPLKRADIAYICDHPWVNTGCETSCLEMSEALAAETPVRLDLLLSLAPAAPSNSNSVVVPRESDLPPSESGAELTSSAPAAVEPSSSAEKRILELVAEGGEDAIKPSPTRTLLVDKRKPRPAHSSASMASMAPQSPTVPEEGAPDSPPAEEPMDNADVQNTQPTLRSSATMTITPSPSPAPELVREATREIVKTPSKEEDKEKTGARPRVGAKKTTPSKIAEKSPEKEELKPEEPKPSAVAAAADKLTSLAQSSSETKTPVKPKKLSIPGGNVGSFKDQFERRASLTTTPEIKRNIAKPAPSKIAKPKALSEDRELSNKVSDNGTVRLQQIGIEPSPTPPMEPEPNRGGVKKTESEPTHGAAAVDPTVLLQDARRSLQNSMAKLVEEKAGEENRRRAARDIISTAIRTGKPPVPYGRSSSAGVASLASPPGTPPHGKLFRTEAQHRVEDHRNRGVSVERIIPIQMSAEEPAPAPAQKAAPAPAPAPRTPVTAPIRRLISSESVSSEPPSSPGEPIKKSAREFIIPIAVEGGGFVTPRQRSLEPEPAAPAPHARLARALRPRRISSLVSGGSSSDEEEGALHRLRPSRLARADSGSSAEDDEEDEAFHLLTAENLFSTLLHRVRALTNRLNGEEGPGFPQHPHSLFNNLQSPFFTSPHLPRRHLLREGWSGRELHADLDSMFNKSRQSMPRGSSKKQKNRVKGPPEGEDEKEESALDLSDLDLGAIEFSEREVRALSGLTPALSRRLQRQLLASLPPAAARSLRRTLSLGAPAPAPAARAARAHSASQPGEAGGTLPRRREPRHTPERDARRGSLERPLLSKYLSERPAPPDEPAPDEPPPRADAPRKRSRFLRSDFFDSPNDESVFARHRKEKELETQRILREIREKRARAEAAAAEGAERSPGARERSRSNTPFFPSLDNIKETVVDAPAPAPSKRNGRLEENSSSDSRLIRPKSYPVKTLAAIDEPAESPRPDAPDAAERKESRLIRPKSYPASSPSPEKVYIPRINKKEDRTSFPKEEVPCPEGKTDVEVSFSITLPRKKTEVLSRTEPIKSITHDKDDTKQDCDKKSTTSTLVLKKYQIVNDASQDNGEKTGHKLKNGSAVTNGSAVVDATKTNSSEESKSVSIKKDDSKKALDTESTEKKGTVKKKIIRKVSSKSKTDLGSGNENGEVKTEKKKVTKKVKDKSVDDDKSAVVTKKKSVLQTIGSKLEKFASSKSSSPEKLSESAIDAKKEAAKLKRTQREQSVPMNIAPTTESNLIKRAVTLTDVAALDQPVANKTTVSKVLGLFKKFEPKEKTKPIMEKSLSVDTADISILSPTGTDSGTDISDKDKPRRPTSLLLNGLGRRNKYSKTSSDSVTNIDNDEQPVLKRDKENENRNSRNSLKLDFSRLPRVKKIVPTNPVIEPQIMNVSSVDDETEKRDIRDRKSLTLLDSNVSNGDASQTSRSRSRSRSTVSNSEAKSEPGPDKAPLSPADASTAHPLRNLDSPEKEDIVDRIRRKSFYSRFNEKKQRRKSSLVGPGAVEYDPLARIHAPPTENKYDLSPTSPVTFDLSPGLSATSDLSPSTERYRALLNDTRNNLKYDSYNLNDKIDTYRSLDRNDFRRYPGTRSYLDYDQPLSYGTNRYSRTKSLLDSCDGTEDTLAHSLRDPLKYNRTLSMYSPGNYATYRPKRTHNPAIILKESEKEPSPENILEKIRQRKKISISVTRKPDHEKESSPRSPVPPKGESDGTECSEKVD